MRSDNSMQTCGIRNGSWGWDRKVPIKDAIVAESSAKPPPSLQCNMGTLREGICFYNVFCFEPLREGMARSISYQTIYCVSSWFMDTLYTNFSIILYHKWYQIVTLLVFGRTGKIVKPLAQNHLKIKNKCCSIIIIFHKNTQL